MSGFGGEQTDSCTSCPMACKQESLGKPEILSGWRFAYASAGTFLLPVLLGILGAACGGPTDTGRFFWGAGGLLSGMLISITACKILRRKEN